MEAAARRQRAVRDDVGAEDDRRKYVIGHDLGRYLAALETDLETMPPEVVLESEARCESARQFDLTPILHAFERNWITVATGYLQP